MLSHYWIFISMRNRTNFTVNKMRHFRHQIFYNKRFIRNLLNLRVPLTPPNEFLKKSKKKKHEKPRKHGVSIWLSSNKKKGKNIDFLGQFCFIWSSSLISSKTTNKKQYCFYAVLAFRVPFFKKSPYNVKWKCIYITLTVCRIILFSV
jgi:hypothetical protein